MCKIAERIEYNDKFFEELVTEHQTSNDLLREKIVQNREEQKRWSDNLKNSHVANATALLALYKYKERNGSKIKIAEKEEEIKELSKTIEINQS